MKPDMFLFFAGTVGGLAYWFMGIAATSKLESKEKLTPGMQWFPATVGGSPSRARLVTVPVTWASLRRKRSIPAHVCLLNYLQNAGSLPARQAAPIASS